MLQESIPDEIIMSSLGTCITRVCAIAGHTYIYVAIRQLMLDAPLLDTFTTQLYDALNDPRHLMQSANSLLMMLLWVLVVGGCAAIERPEWEWFVNQVLRIVVLPKIDTVDQLRQLLQQIVWLERPFRDALAELWLCVQDHLEFFGLV